MRVCGYYNRRGVTLSGWARVYGCYSQKEASPVPMVDCGGLLNRLKSLDEDAGKPLLDVMGADDRRRPEAGP